MAFIIPIWNKKKKKDFFVLQYQKGFLEGTAKADELDVLTFLVKKYEDEKYPIDLPDPIEALKFRREQMGLKNSDLIPYIGSKSKVSEVLNRKRSL